MESHKHTKVNKRTYTDINRGLNVCKSENLTPLNKSCKKNDTPSRQKIDDITTPRPRKVLFEDSSKIIIKNDHYTPVRNNSKESFDKLGVANRLNQSLKYKSEGTPRKHIILAKDMTENHNKSLFNTPIRNKIKDSSEKLDVLGKMHVAVRFRPLTHTESLSGASYPLEIQEKTIIVKNSYDFSAGLATSYVYDNVFWSSKDAIHQFSSQKKVFDEVALPLLKSALEGYNACLFAYGQTGSGKTYSMMGYDDTFVGEESGIIPRFCHELLARIPNHNSHLEVEVSYFEIYNEKIHDLLSTSSDYEKKTSLRIREHPLTGPYVENLSTHRVSSIKEMKFLLTTGNSRRATGSTAHNERSSRSHTILEIIVSSCLEVKQLHSKVSLVDLAGSERVASCQISGERFKEGLSINKSLLTLGKVIGSLSDMKKGNFVPYRESVLTWLLKESLGGNSQTVMLATVSPSSLALDETLATLRYACQARHIINKVVVNEDPQLKVIRELRQEVERLKTLKEDYTKNQVSENVVKDGCILNKQDSYGETMSSRQNKLLVLEMQQKAAEGQLQMELTRLSESLKDAEKRRVELESQKEAFLKNVQNDRVSVYRSDFFENLQTILNNPTDNLHPEQKSCEKKNGVLAHLEDIKVSLEALQNTCSDMLESRQESNILIRRTIPVLERMQNNYQELYDILIINYFTNSK